MIEEREIRHFHLFCGLGGGALGFNRGRAEVGNLRARFRCIGGVDVSAASIRDFNQLAGVPGTVLDLFDREQYIAFHGVQPPATWREAGVADIQAAAGGERPHIVFLSAPCKGFSGLLSETRSKTNKYQALNRLTLRGVFLMLEAWADDPPELVIFENVPRIATRGRALLDQITKLLRNYGYAVAETTHDCGEIGGLAQSRKRFLLVARHAAKVQPFLYQPEKRPLRAVGEILEQLPMPGDERGGAMHLLPNLQWKTWVRLAFVEARSDWRSLNRLKVLDGKLADFLLVADRRHCAIGVTAWDGTSGTIAGESHPSNGTFAVADPRAGQAMFHNAWKVVAWDESAQAVTGQTTPSNGALNVADPRFANPQGEHQSKYAVQSWDRSSKTITGSDRIGSGALCIADPRVTIQRVKGDNYLTNGNYGVVSWDQSCGAVSSAAGIDNGRWSVADPRNEELPEASQTLVAVIRSMDGTWHRPFTTLELAALQSLVDPSHLFDLDGTSDGAKRERIGNAVPPRAAQAIADLMGKTLLLAWSGETFQLSATPIWVNPVAVALSVRTPGAEVSE